jgi:hypothetical protein
MTKPICNPALEQRLEQQRAGARPEQRVGARSAPQQGRSQAEQQRDFATASTTDTQVRMPVE